MLKLVLVLLSSYSCSARELYGNVPINVVLFPLTQAVSPVYSTDMYCLSKASRCSMPFVMLSTFNSLVERTFAKTTKLRRCKYQSHQIHKVFRRHVLLTWRLPFPFVSSFSGSRSSLLHHAFLIARYWTRVGRLRPCRS